ncbi:MAG: 4Fe-4S dicluster domain-containing protein [Deltaproteobacteria bacterium]|nr:4Fe-4S dicluster domain-containing protein [Deltaproteobacteria bacterium]
MNDQMVAHREILWNVGTPANVILMYALFALGLFVAAVGIFRRIEMWQSGAPDKERDMPWHLRIADLFKWVVFQRGVVSDRAGGVMHTLIYTGFLVLLFTTTMVLIDHDFGIKIYHGEFYLAVTLMSDLFGAGLLIGCVLAAYRRYVTHSDRLHSRTADIIALGVLALLILQGFVLEGLRIHVTGDPWAAYSPIGAAFAGFFWPLSIDASRILHFGIWWFHTVTVFVALALVPYTKFFHIVASSINLYLSRSNRPKGALRPVGDLQAMLESGEEFSIGLSSIKDYSWKELMDLDACTSCGRCQEACPAYNSGKPLSPKWLILDTRNHALALTADNKLFESALPSRLERTDSSLLGSLYLKSSGLERADDGSWTYASDGSFRASNPMVQQAAFTLGGSTEKRVLGEVMDPNVFWSCTTCMACVQACPVGINHVDQIVENRRNAVLMHGELPSEAQATLRALENRSNPYGPQEERTKWLEGLDVKVLQPGDSVDYLYWVGCVSSYDPRKQKIARALVQIMKQAGLSFGILGKAEGCSGDPARRLGEENLFQTLAKSNLDILRSISFKTVVANCPHCFNTLKHEYPQLGNLQDGRTPEIIHHSVLLKRLIAEKKISQKESRDTFTFHDPCYLGRYNDEYNAPRDTLKAGSPFPILEIAQSRENAMCCGAGGGHFWMDLKIGERVNTIRTDQLAASGAENVATACPFCMQMIEDGVKLTNREDTMAVRDIAEVVLERMEPSTGNGKH